MIKCVDMGLEAPVDVLGFCGTPAGPIVGICVHPLTGQLYSTQLDNLTALGTPPPIIVDADKKNPRPVYPNTSIDEQVHEGLTKGAKNESNRRR